MEKSVEERVTDLEKRMAVLEGRVQGQPKVINAIKVPNIDLSQISIKDLVNELIKRKDCVTELRPEPYEKYSIVMEHNGTITDLGPATILKIID